MRLRRSARGTNTCASQRLQESSPSHEASAQVFRTGRAPRTANLAADCLSKRLRQRLGILVFRHDRLYVNVTLGLPIRGAQRSPCSGGMGGGPAMKCWQCVSENSSAMTFCGQFGAALASASVPKAVSPNDGRVAPTLEGTIEGDGKLITILFAHVSGLTALRAPQPRECRATRSPPLRPPGALHPASRRHREQVHGLG
jgi:hypothetical protein